MSRLIVTLLAALPLLANDTFVHESGGNLMFVQNNSVSILREQLTIGPPESGNPTWRIPIHVEYDLSNASGDAVQARIGFPLPACTLGDYIWQKHLDYVSGSASSCVKEPQMKLLVDGRMITGRWGYVFLRDGFPLGTQRTEIELSRKISALIDVVHDPDQRFYKEDPVFLKSAKELCTRLGGQMKGSACSAFSRIAVHRTFLWDYIFEKNSRVRVVHDFRVNATWNLHPADVFSSDVFCTQDPATRLAWNRYMEDLKRKEKQQQYEETYPREFFTEYVLHTGALWAGPIRDFELIFRKSSPAQIVSTCFSGVTKTNAMEFRAHRKDYKPSEDLRVLYLNP